jgi:hypothetical protein
LAFRRAALDEYGLRNGLRGLLETHHALN